MGSGTRNPEKGAKRKEKGRRGRGAISQEARATAERPNRRRNSCSL